MIYSIPISWLSKASYCEYQIYLEHVECLEKEITFGASKGSKIHAFLKSRADKRATHYFPVREAIKQARDVSKSFAGREVPVTGHHTRGYIDEVRITPAAIYIIDDKPANTPREGDKMQVLGYCNAFQECYMTGMPLIACLRNRDSQKMIWKEQFLEKHSKSVARSVKRLKGILEGTANPRPANDLNTCKKCMLNSVCDVFWENSPRVRRLTTLEGR